MRGTAERILEAADEVLAESGYEGASVRAVAERAGVNKALVFYHYDNKSALFDRVLERYYQRHLETLREAFAGTGDPRERLHRVLDAYLTFMEENSRYPRLVQQILTGSGDKIEVVRANLAPMQVWVEEALGELCPEQGSLSARHFFVTFSSLVTGYFTYAPALTVTWGEDPLGGRALDERRGHLHWLLDRLVDGLEQRPELGVQG